MENSLKIALGIVAGALVVGLLSLPAMAQTGFGGKGMMGNAFAGFDMTDMHKRMMGGNFDMNAMHRAMHGNSSFDMNAMHKAMHGEDPEVDMNQMHARMMAGNLTQEDLNEMKDCPMMRNWNATQ